LVDETEWIGGLSEDFGVPITKAYTAKKAKNSRLLAFGMVAGVSYLATIIGYADV
jgi:hypothetical protein